MVINCQANNHLGFLKKTAVAPYTSSMNKVIGERIKDARRKLGWSQEDLAKAAGISQSGVHKIESGLAKETRKLLQIAKALKIDAEWLVNSEGKTLLNKDSIKITTMGSVNLTRVEGKVSAGIFGEPLNNEDDAKPYVLLDHNKLFYAPEKHFALEVQGDSMNEFYDHGATVFCVKLRDITRKLKTGDHVIVERQYAGKYEYTIKEIEFKQDGSVWLKPRSKNPAYSPFVIYDVGVPQIEDGKTITVIALVMPYYQGYRHV